MPASIKKFLFGSQELFHEKNVNKTFLHDFKMVPEAVKICTFFAQVTCHECKKVQILFLFFSSILLDQRLFFLMKQQSDLYEVSWSLRSKQNTSNERAQKVVYPQHLFCSMQEG